MKSASKDEEVIAVLWAILASVLYIAKAPSWLFWSVVIKALFDIIASVKFAIDEIKIKRGIAPNKPLVADRRSRSTSPGGPEE